MPSIEIICINQKKCSRFNKLTFALESENKLVSHRSFPLFKKDFDMLKGCIYHLGCPHLKKNKRETFEAFDLLSKECQGQDGIIFLEFKKKFVPDVQRILIKLLKNSPDSKIVFTSDYQYSSNKPIRIHNLSLTEFWELHKNKKLLFNTLYELINLQKA